MATCEEMEVGCFILCKQSWLLHSTASLLNLILRDISVKYGAKGSAHAEKLHNCHQFF